MPISQEVIDLIERFKRNREAYLSNEYNEAQVRLELINPFFKGLGWDMYNEAGYAEAYKDVVHEDAIKIGGATKAPDYAFRIGGVRKFFVEAKRPGVDIKNDPDPAYQLRRYAWSAKLPLSILTDFEEFAVYDCRMKPNKEDKASTARILYFTYHDYEDRWDEIASIFSREEILKGSFDRYAESAKKKRGTAEVDDAFLKEIENWRDLFARNIALRNPDLSTRELNYAVQRTVDRIIFLRICEDRGIESYGQLRGLQNGTRAYERLCQVFRRADERYNSGLFHFSAEKERPDPPDDLTLNLTIDDKVLKEVFKGLYYPESPFEFSVLPADILGHIYEQFLGKVIRLTPGHHAKVEDKPEVKKAGGVYYTPTYIVDYIVKNTVGKLLEGKTPNQVAKLRMLDPACGSGSFLLGAYQYLLDWHQEWYAKHDPEKHAKGRSPKVYPGPGGEWRLTTAEKKRILLNNIYGVDIDTQAVEVTNLSLLLKVLEGENAETLGKSLRLFHERALPDLGENIKCGNSLIGPDFYEGKQLSLLDDEERYRINAFDWEAEFAEIMEAGGFDVVIGNPPYVRSVALKESSYALWDFCRSHYQSASAREWDIYLVFVERGLDLLTSKGKLGYILPNKFLNSQVGEKLRVLLSEGRHVERIVSFGAFQIFYGATTYTCLLFLDRGGLDQVAVTRYAGPLGSSHAVCALPEETPSQWNTSEFSSEQLSGHVWDSSVFGNPIMEKLHQWPNLGSFVDIFQGTGTRADKVYAVEERHASTTDVRVYSKEKGAEYHLEVTFLKPVLRGRSIGRYQLEDEQNLLIVPYELVGDQRPTLVSEEEIAAIAPKTLAYLRQCKERLDQREKGRFKGRDWYRFGRPQNMSRFDMPEKIVMPDVAKRGTCYLDRAGRWLLDSAYAIVPKSSVKLDLRFVLAMLNSPLLTYFLKETGTMLRGGYFRMKTAYLNPFPMRDIDFTNPNDKAHHDRIVEFVESMLKLHKDLQAAKTDHDRKLIQRQIDATDKQIDQLVYKLYNLTDKEIHIVEEAMR
jgi:hypothetical protein